MRGWLRRCFVALSRTNDNRFRRTRCMSRIYDAVRIAREERSRAGLDRSDSLGTMELPDRRISPRLELDFDLAAYGHSEDGSTFYERTKAISGNANGAVFLLSTPVVEGQDVLLISDRTSEEQICKVVGVHIRDLQTSEVSVRFPAPNVEFWKTAG